LTNKWVDTGGNVCILLGGGNKRIIKGNHQLLHIITILQKHLASLVNIPMANNDTDCHKGMYIVY